MAALPASSGIYAIKNTMDGKVYVGSAVNLKRRWSDHSKQLRGQRHANVHLQRAWDSCGGELFTFLILEMVAAKELLVEREQHWIDLLLAAEDGGYNFCKVAGNTLGTKRTEESKAKMSAAQKMRPPLTEDQRARIAAGQLGRRHTAETRAKIAAGNTGKTFSEASLAKMAAWQLGRKFTDEHCAKLSAAKKGKPKPPGFAEKISSALTGKKKTAEHVANMSLARKGKKAAPETRAKMAATKLGTKATAETRAKISSSQMGRKMSPESVAKRLATIDRKRAERIEAEKYQQ